VLGIYNGEYAFELSYSFHSSVALTGPAVFQFTSPSAPDRHRQALAIFNNVSLTDPSITKISDGDIGSHLYEAIARFLDGLGVPRGLKGVG
jgi:hydroxyacid-oxoacid transhydrogenase